MPKKLHFIHSAMDAGKSIALLQVAHNYEKLGQSTLLYTSALDNRYGVGKITSRLGPSRRAWIYTRDTNLLDELKDKLEGQACVLIDEAQFLTKQQVQHLHYITQCWDIPVMAYGLRTDSKAEPFEGAAYLLALAESIVELKTVCTCGKKATMNMRVDANGDMVLGGEQVVIGGDDCYRSVCGRCFYTTRTKRMNELGLA